MNNWIAYFIEVNVYILIIGLSYHIGFRKAKNFKFGRPYLLIGTILSFFLPLIKTPVLAKKVDSILASNYILETIRIDSTPTVSFNFQILLFTVIAIGFVFKSSRLLLGIFKINKLKQTCDKTNNCYLIQNGTHAFSFLNSIFIGADIPENKKELILRHEQIHTQRGHSYDLLILHCLQSILWYNPVIYLISTNLKELHEYEADQIDTIDKQAYIDLLLQQNFDNFKLSFIQQFNSNHLKNRIMRIKSKTSKNVSKASIFITLIALSVTIAISQSISLNAQSYNLNLVDLANMNELSKLDQLAKLSNIGGEVEKKAEYPGGQKAFIKYMIENIKYPEEAKKENVSGTVFIEFTIAKDGKCKDFIVKRGINESLDEAALKVLKAMPEWEAAEKDGKKVSSKQTVPIKFELPTE